MWQMQRTVAEFDEARFQSLGPGYVALSLAGEAGELANVIKKAWRVDPRIGQAMGYGVVGPEHHNLIADEIADVVMLSLVLANHLGIDVEAEVERKLQTIDQRVQAGYYGQEQKADQENAAGPKNDTLGAG
jgi:NTP pyrophosphatase (non-canonical NTP hydrolase)